MNKLNKKVANQGFTLIEILVVIGIIAVLAAVVLIAINPARQFAQANNSQRTANTNAILNGIGQFMADNQGSIDGLNIPEGDADDAENIADDGADLCAGIVPDYMPALPVDPTVDGGAIDSESCDDYDTEYTAYRDSTTGRISVCAPLAAGEDALDDAEEICVTR